MWIYREIDCKDFYDCLKLLLSLILHLQISSFEQGVEQLSCLLRNVTSLVQFVLTLHARYSFNDSLQLRNNYLLQLFPSKCIYVYIFISFFLFVSLPLLYFNAKSYHALTSVDYHRKHRTNTFVNETLTVFLGT